MSSEYNFNFDSQGYQSVSFSKMLVSILSIFQDQDESVAFLNSVGYGFMRKARNQRIQIIAKAKSYIEGVKNIDNYFSIIYEYEEIFLIKQRNIFVPDNLIFFSLNDNEFFRAVITKIIIVLKYYTWHIYQYLSRRSYDDFAIADIDEVQKMFAEIYLYLYKIDVMFSANNVEIYDHEFFNDISLILSKLVVLGGARSILNEGIINFTNDYEIFRKVFTQTSQEVL